VEDFMKRTSIIYATAATLRDWGPHIVSLAKSEGLDGHARAIIKRLDKIAD